MLNYFDVLKAQSGIPVDDIWAEIWGRGLQGGYKIIEYTGSLPITINADGNVLIDYRIYGADGGVGEPTESGEPAGYKLPMVTRSRNLLAPIETEQIIDLKPNAVYVVSRYKRGRVDISVYDENDTLIYSDYLYIWAAMIFGGYAKQKYAKVLMPSSLANHASIVEGDEEYTGTSTPCPSTYIPYSHADTPVYIGENQLDSVEGVSDYVDKSSGKIVRMIGEYTFTGDESFNKYGGSDVFYTSKTIDPVGITTVNTITMRCDHPAFTAIENKDTRYWLNPEADDVCCFLPGGMSQVFLRSTSNFTTAAECKAYLKSQYDNGTPVKISYWLKTPIEEDPPVSFPDIPTIKGETIIDYDGTPKPSQMYIKYKARR